MAKREVLGKMQCPECGHPDAEIKPQKTAGLAYRWCPECNAQYFARTPETSARLLEKARGAPVTVTQPDKPAMVPSAKPEKPVSVKRPAAKNTMFDLLGIGG